MNFLWLKYFAEIADCGGLAKAAKKIRVSAPSLSHILQKLENEVGSPLFERRRGRLYLNDKGEELEMGTLFDEFNEKTETDYFEHNDGETIRNNRRLLYNIMVSAGFTNLPSEWWHYDYLDRFYAYYNNCPAKYEGVFTFKEVKNYK